MKDSISIGEHTGGTSTQRESRLPPSAPPVDTDYVVNGQDPVHANGNLHRSLQQGKIIPAPDHNTRRPSAIGFSPQSVSDLGRDVLQTAVTSSRDAMGLLFKAAAEEPDGFHDTDVEGERPRSNTTSPAGTSPDGELRLCLPSEVSPELVDIWTKHRFVRQGWFSPYEAIAYIEL